MKSTLVPLVLLVALATTACTGGSTATEAEPRAVFPSSEPTFASGPDAVVEVVHGALPAVVNVVSETPQGRGEGTRFVVRSDGIIVTNYHVVESANTITVLTSDEDPQSYDAIIIACYIHSYLSIL